MCIYTDTGWLDRLTSYNGATISYDDIGNPINYNNGSAYTFAWENGREMSLSYHNGILTTYEYGADGLRTQKTYGSTTYNYYYADGQLIRQTWGTHYIDFLYDETGSVYSIINDGTQYYFVKNLQGDVVQIRSVYGTVVVEYTYDAWGNVLSITGLYADTLGKKFYQSICLILPVIDFGSLRRYLLTKTQISYTTVFSPHPKVVIAFVTHNFIPLKKKYLIAIKATKITFRNFLVLYLG
jgi:YD repeat-containing protein